MFSALLSLCLSSLSGFRFFEQTFLGFFCFFRSIDFDHFTDSGLLFQSFWMGEKEGRGSEGKGSHVTPHLFTPLLWPLATSLSPRLRHHHCHTVACHTDSTVQTRLLQIPRRLPVVFGFCFVFFFCLFFYNSNNHSTYYCSSL